MIIPQHNQQIIILCFHSLASKHLHKVLHTLLTQLRHEFQVLILLDLIFRDGVLSGGIGVAFGEEFTEGVEQGKEFEI